MNRWQEHVYLWHKAAQCPAPESVTTLTAEALKRRAELIREESGEVVEALRRMAAGDPEPTQDPAAHAEAIHEILDGLIDTIWTLLGTAVEMGIDLEGPWEAVMRANFSKAPYPKNEWGKVLKPEGWKAPFLPIGNQGIAPRRP